MFSAFFGFSLLRAIHDKHLYATGVLEDLDTRT